LINDVLLDAGTRHDAARIKRMIGGRAVTAHALTHVHPDHQGASHELCEQLGIELWAPAGEVAFMEAGTIPGSADSIPARFMRAVASGPGHPVARELREGDAVGGFVAVSTPGHSPDHLSFFRESDRVLIAGDAVRNFNYLTMGPKISTPFDGFSDDPELVKRSARALIELRPSLVAFGHGSPVDGEKFIRGMAALEL
jgi:glyoxylase-like metal-dependent hydrolase (beta-lactamase superfamily II)